MSDLVINPEDRSSHNEAHLIQYIDKAVKSALYMSRTIKFVHIDTSFDHRYEETLLIS